MKSKEEILKILRKMLITRLNLEKKEEDITINTILFGPGENSLGLDSVDGLEIVVGVANEFGLTITEEEGPQILCYVVSTACASGTNSIGIGYDLIKSGVCDVVITGGVDCITPLVMSGFNQLQAISKDTIKPFSKKRNGTVLGEGGAIMILEREEIAKNKGIYAEITGYSMLNDGYHMTAPDPTGESIKRLILNTINISNKSLDDVDYINAHGTGTLTNDQVEAKAIKELFKNKKPYVNSTKSLVGHLLAAAGSIESIATVLQIKNCFISATANVEEDVLDGVNLVTKKIDIDIDFALNISLGFGGNGCCVGFSRI